MKKVLLFALLAFASLAAKAQTSYSLYIDTYPWNYTAAISGKIVVTFGSQWGEFKLTSDNTVDVSEYTGYKIVISEVSDVQIKLENENSDGHYPELTVGTNEYTFVQDEGNVKTFELQGKEADATITVEEAYLVKADGTEEAMVYGGASWGCTFDAYEPAAITYTGQYGGVYLLNPETDEPFTYTYGSGETHTITVTLAEALEQDLTVELDENGSGFAWINLEAGQTEYTITIDDDACLTYDEDGNVTGNGNVDQLYLKANGSTFPFTVNYKSIVDVVTTGGGGDDTDDYFVSLDFEGDNSYWDIDEDYSGLVISDDTNVTPGMDGYHFLGDGGYGCASNTVLISQTSQKELPAGTYTVSARINVGSDMTDLEFFAQNSDGTNDSALIMAYNSADWTAEDRVSVEITLDEDDYVTIGIRTGASDLTSKYLWLIADNFEVESGTTGISSVPAVTAKGTGAIYNLAGQRVNESAKGLLIKNGKKVLVK